jgi:hypothetical protein
MRARLPLTLLALSLGAVSVAAEPQSTAAAAPAPVNYVAGFVGTTLAYRPNGGSWDGWQKDATTLLGYGRQLTPKLALELDAGPSWASGSGYASFAFTPGLVYSLNPSVYVAARFAIPVDPETNLVLLPGVGLSHAFGRVMPTLELNVSSAVGRGKPDLGVTLTLGLLVFF